MVKNLGKPVLWVEEIGSTTVVDPLSGATINLAAMAAFERTPPAMPGSKVSYSFCEEDPKLYAHRSYPVSVPLPGRNVTVNIYKALRPIELPVLTHAEAVERRRAIGQRVNRHSW